MFWHSFRIFGKLLHHRKSLTSKLEGSWKAASGTAGFSWESILYNAVIFLERQKPYWAILLYLVTWCWTVPLSRLHAEKMLLLVDCLPGCVFVARRCAKHSKGALACQRRYVSNTKGKMCQSVIVVSYYMSPSHHVIICHNCMQRWQTSTMLLAAVFLTPCAQYVAWICQGFGSSVQPTWPLDLDTQTTKWLQQNDKRTITHLWSFETFVVLMDVASCGTETLGAAYMNGYFNAEIALKIGGPGQAVTISDDLLFYRVSSLKRVKMLQLNQKRMNTQVIREYPRSLITSFLLQRFVIFCHAFNLCPDEI